MSSKLYTLYPTKYIIFLFTAKPSGDSSHIAARYKPRSSVYLGTMHVEYNQRKRLYLLLFRISAGKKTLNKKNRFSYPEAEDNFEG